MSASQVKAVSLADLQGIVGASNARDADATDSVDGVHARFVVEPGSTVEVSGLLRIASAHGLAVIPRGSGSKLGWGNIPSHVDLIVSMVRMNRLLEHAAGDLVVRVEAGARLHEVQERLAGANQRLALDPPETGATLGGIVGANASGPLRLRFGTSRDLLIGVTTVLPDGTIARSGGKVVKNVAGYDLGKLLTGSCGTLGIMVETIFRLHPCPAAYRTVLLPDLSSPDDLGRAVQVILHSSLVPSALEFSWTDTGMLIVMFEGIEPGVLGQVEAALHLLRPFGEGLVLPDDEQRNWWEGWRDRPDRTGSEVDLKVAIPPADLPLLLRTVTEVTRSCGVTSDVTGHAGTCVFMGRLLGTPETLVEAIGRIRAKAVSRGGSAVVHHAPPEVKRAIDVWGPVGDALPLMRRVKEQFDPDGMMSPGRFVGGL